MTLAITGTRWSANVVASSADRPLGSELACLVTSLHLARQSRGSTSGFNPAEHRKLPRERRTGNRNCVKPWSVEELAKWLTEAVRDHFAGVWVLAATTDMRRSELAGVDHGSRWRCWPLHDVRHSYATLSSLDSGIDPKILSDRVGHSNLNVTLGLYVHRSTGKDRAAAEKLAKAIEDALGGGEIDPAA